jgi:hypothetical protein
MKELGQEVKKRHPISRDPPKLMKFSDFLKKTKKRKSSDFRHGRKNRFFEKIQKQTPRGPPWACLYKQAAS